MKSTIITIALLFFIGCNKPEPLPSRVVDGQPVKSESKINVVQEFESLKASVIPAGDEDKWATSSILGWSNFMMDFPDDDHVAKQFADRFASRKCRFTEVLRDDVEALSKQWLHAHKGTDEIVIKKHGLEIAVGGYREPGLIRMKLAFTIDHK
jgi:hypothetical protein